MEMMFSYVHIPDGTLTAVRRGGVECYAATPEVEYPKDKVLLSRGPYGRLRSYPHQRSI
jgi:hypothetical protein